MIITIQDLKWSNWFSYGEDNYINFEQPVLQIMGANGTGKTSIPVILQEVYYGKNSKSKRKSSLPNRYLDKPLLKAESNFIDDNGNTYKIVLSRKATLKLQLFKNGLDISSHTTTNTYKTIQNILGLDFKTFAQLIYQSSTDNLEFLTATDANRKKFLITLFNLNKYLNIHEIFKVTASEINTELVGLNSKISTIESWIKTNEKIPLVEQVIQDIPEIDDEDIDNLGQVRINLANITETNKKINKNNQYKELLEGLDTSILYENIVPATGNKAQLIKDKNSITVDLIRYETAIKALASTKIRIKSLEGICPSCEQEISENTKNIMLKVATAEEDSLIDSCVLLNDTIHAIEADLLEIQKIATKTKKKEDIATEVGRLTISIDRNMSKEVLDEILLKAQIKEISNRISTIKSSIMSISNANKSAAAHNSKIKVISEQLDAYKLDIDNVSIKVTELSNVLNKVNIIKKAYSPSGLLSYKIDFLVKDLETEINQYLGILSSGKFQLLFKLENEKLNIEIIDEGIAVSIEELSAGELARINASTLLAIRKLMAAISSTKINILFLDEIMAVLDEGGKEMLIEVLHNEKELNTLLVSHEWSHPLIPKINIVKENKVSRIDNG